MTKTVLYVHPSNELYGADRSLLRLVQNLDRTEFSPVVAIANDVPYEEGLLTAQLAALDVPYVELKLGVLRRRYLSVVGLLVFAYQTVTAAWWLARYCRHHNIALVHTNSLAVLSGGLAAWLTRTPHVWHVREIITAGWLNWFLALALRLFATRVVAVSGPVQRHLVAAQPRLARKTMVIHNGIDVARFMDAATAVTQAIRDEWQIPADALVVGMVGRISAWKGQEFLLQAAYPLLRQRDDVILVFVGGDVPGETAHQDTLTRLIQTYGVADKVRLVGFRADIPPVLAALDVFVLPSTRPDPFPTVVLEAMAAGKPVIATAHGGSVEQVQPGETGLLVSPVDATEMTQALEQLLNPASPRRNMGLAGRQRALAHFVTSRYVADVVRVYRELLGSGD